MAEIEDDFAAGLSLICIVAFFVQSLNYALFRGRADRGFIVHDSVQGHGTDPEFLRKFAEIDVCCKFFLFHCSDLVQIIQHLREKVNRQTLETFGKKCYTYNIKPFVLNSKRRVWNQKNGIASARKNRDS